MKLLVMGGTGYVGRRVVEAAVGRGHAVTLFNRGQSDPDAFPGLECLHGDRTRDLSALHGREWDAVVDTSGYVPSVVGASARLLASAVGHYTFVSTLYVYADQTGRYIDESAPVSTLDDVTDETVTPQTVGPLKAASERAVAEALPGRALIPRCGTLVGPNDRNGRFTYWARRVARGGEVLAPVAPTTPVQVIDVRDLATWIVTASERGTSGTFNVAGPERPITMGTFLDAVKNATGSDARFTWVTADFLREQELSTAERLALFLWERGATANQLTNLNARAMPTLDVRHAVSAGLRHRPLAETVRDTLAWDRERPAGTEYRADLAPDHERSLLEAWHRWGAAVV